MEPGRRFAISFFTPGGAALAARVEELLARRDPQSVCTRFDKNAGPLRSWVQQELAVADALLFIGATGIAVRMINGLLRGKDRDPAVLVMEETGAFVIPLLSGHLGGANQLAEELAEELGAQAVITTATDRRGIFAVDLWAKSQDCAIANLDGVKHVSAALLRGEPVGLHSEFPLGSPLPPGLEGNAERPVNIRISLKAQVSGPGLTLHLVPRIGVLGAGCRRNTPFPVFQRTVLHLLAQRGIAVQALKTLASIDIKQDEACLREFADTYGLEFRVFSAAALQAVPGRFTASAFVREQTGVDNVCERAAMAAGAERLLFPKTSGNGVSLSLGLLPWQCHFH